MSDEPYEQGSRAEAVEAVIHHRHHPDDPNVGVIRARPARHAILAGALAAAITVIGVVLLAVAIGSR